MSNLINSQPRMPTNSSQAVVEPLIHRLQNIYFKLEQLNESIKVSKTSQTNVNIAQTEQIELTSNKQYYLSELNQALSNNLYNLTCLQHLKTKFKTKIKHFIPSLSYYKNKRVLF